MSRKTDQTSLTPLIVRSTAIALIAAVMPLGLDISSDGNVSFGAPVAHASTEGEGRGDRGNNGLGNGGEASQGENEGGDSDPSNPGRGGRGGGDAGDGAGSGGGEGGSGAGGGGGEGGGGSSRSQGSGSDTGSTPSVPGPSTSEAVDVFSASAEPIGPDLTENEEQDLISRGWQ